MEEPSGDVPPPVPVRSSERKHSIENNNLSSEGLEPKSILEKKNQDIVEEVSEFSKDNNSKSNNKVEEEKEKEEEKEEEIGKNLTSVSIQEEKEDDEGEVKEEVEEVEDGKEEGKEDEDEDEDKEEPEINPTLSRIHKIGIGLPSLLPEGGLSSIKLRSRKREDSYTGTQFERLDEDGLKKWIYATVQRDEEDGNLFEILHDGQLLCDLINVLRPEKQIVAKKGKMRPWHIVNINAYLKGCVDLQMKTIFKAEDLYEGEELDSIIDNLNELKFYADNKK